jgi:hypothetical protein
MDEAKLPEAVGRAAWRAASDEDDAWLVAALLEPEQRAGAVLARVLADLAAEARVEVAVDVAAIDAWLASD